MKRLDTDTRTLYRLIAKRGSDWVKKRLCPQEAAQFALYKEAKAEPELVLPEVVLEDDGEPQ